MYALKLNKKKNIVFDIGNYFEVLNLFSQKKKKKNP